MKGIIKKKVCEKIIFQTTSLSISSGENEPS
jgi:hypothetical protein